MLKTNLEKFDRALDEVILCVVIAVIAIFAIFVTPLVNAFILGAIYQIFFVITAFFIFHSICAFFNVRYV